MLLTLAALGLIANGAKPEVVALAWVLAGVAPFVLLRDFGRSLRFRTPACRPSLAAGFSGGGDPVRHAGVAWMDRQDIR